jgi:hypothetical protein
VNVWASRPDFSSAVGCLVVWDSSRAREDRTATTSGALRARQLFEQRNTGSFDKRKLDQLRDALEEFRGRDYGALFRQWQVQGDCGVAAKEPFALFDTYRLPHDYSFFGELTKGVPHEAART